VKLGTNASDTCKLLSEVYEGEARKKSNAFEWHKLFTEDREDVRDDERIGRPISHRIEENI
jgi:hypothetical protein